MPNRIEEEVLRALRRISRLVDLQSRRLVSQFGLTGPQLVCLRAIAGLNQTSPSVVAREVSLSQATVTGVIDRLVARQLVTRVRSEVDRRQVMVSVTVAGRALVAQAPSPLQARFVDALTALSAKEQESILASLESIIEMMGGSDIPAAPVLSTSVAPQSPEELADLQRSLDVDGVDLLPPSEDFEDDGRHQ